MSEEIKVNEELFSEIEKLKNELTENVIKIGRLRKKVSSIRLHDEIFHIFG